MGVDPSGPETSKHSARHILECLQAAYEGAVKRAEFEGYVEPCLPFEAPEPDDLMAESAVLRSVVLWERLDDFREYGLPDTLTGWLGHGDVLFATQRFSRRELSRWLKDNNMKSVYKFNLEQPQALGVSGISRVESQPEKPLTNRERDTLLTIIGVLCNEAKLDFNKHAKTAALIQGSASRLGISIGETTIENHLKKVADAFAGRMK